MRPKGKPPGPKAIISIPNSDMKTNNIFTALDSTRRIVLPGGSAPLDAEVKDHRISSRAKPARRAMAFALWTIAACLCFAPRFCHATVENGCEKAFIYMGTDTNCENLGKWESDSTDNPASKSIGLCDDIYVLCEARGSCGGNVKSYTNYYTGRLLPPFQIDEKPRNLFRRQKWHCWRVDALSCLQGQN